MLSELELVFVKTDCNHEWSKNFRFLATWVGSYAERDGSSVSDGELGWLPAASLLPCMT